MDFPLSVNTIFEYLEDIFIKLFILGKKKYLNVNPINEVFETFNKFNKQKNTGRAQLRAGLR